MFSEVFCGTFDYPRHHRIWLVVRFNCDSNENQSDVLYLFGTHGPQHKLVRTSSWTYLTIVSEALSEFSACRISGLQSGQQSVKNPKVQLEHDSNEYIRYTIDFRLTCNRFVLWVRKFFPLCSN